MILSDILKTQLAGEEHLPKLNFHVSESVVSTEDERLLFTIKMAGLPFETVTDGALDDQNNSLNNLFLSLGRSSGARLSIWAHQDHYRTDFHADYEYKSKWMRDFSTRYMSKFVGKDIFENAFYLTFIIKGRDTYTNDDLLREAVEIQQTVMQTLNDYDVELLTTYEKNGFLFSRTYEFMAYLYNGYWESVPVTSEPLFRTIPQSTHHFHQTLMETRFPNGRKRFATLFDGMAFPHPSSRGRTIPVLDLPFEFILCHSFSYVQSAETIRQINQQMNKMDSAGDEAEHQKEEMEEAKGYISSGEIFFGEYHAALLVFAKDERKAHDFGTMAKTTLGGACGYTFTPASLSAPETFFSIFPHNLKRRPRPMPKTTRNFACIFGMNCYSSGKQSGNPIGDGEAIIPLQTSANGVYHFNFHWSLKELDARGELRAGHTVILGATGAGKTTLQATLLAFMERYDARIFAVDKDGSMRGLIEGLGGTYFTLQKGVKTGLNPFQLPDDAFNRSFLYKLVEACGRKGNEDATAEDSRDIKIAVDNVFRLPFESRRFAVVLQSLPDRGADCLARRLAKWVETDEGTGQLAYALDNDRNEFDWENFSRVGFDVSEFLVENEAATEPLLAYLFHLKTLMTRKGGLLATVVEEFWLPIKYKTTAEQILDVLKTGRRRQEFMLLVSQSPEDAIQSPLLPAILQQTPTKIFLPNPDAEFKTHDGGGYSRFGLNSKEFAKLKAIGLQDRKFLVKQGSQSSIAKLDLAGFGDDIAVLATAQEDFQYIEAAKLEAGNNPDNWIPVYQKLRREGKQKASKQKG